MVAPLVAPVVAGGGGAAAAGGLGGMMAPLMALSAGTGLLSLATNAEERKRQAAAAEHQRKLDILQSIISIAGGKGPMGIDATPNITPSNAGQAIGGVGNDWMNIMATDANMRNDSTRAAAAAAAANSQKESSSSQGQEFWDAFFKSLEKGKQQEGNPPAPKDPNEEAPEKPNTAYRPSYF